MDTVVNPRYSLACSFTWRLLGRKETRLLLSEWIEHTFMEHGPYARTVQDPRDTVAVVLWWRAQKIKKQCLDCENKERKQREGSREAGRFFA